MCDVTFFYETEINLQIVICYFYPFTENIFIKNIYLQLKSL